MSRMTDDKGSVLVSAAMAAGVLAILVAGYLAYVSNEYHLISHSAQWSQALHLAEGAVELGFAELCYRYPAGTGFQTGNGWSNPSSGVYTRTVPNFTSTAGATVGSFTVIVSGVGGTNPTILGVGTCVNLHGASVSRAVNVTTKKGSGYALVGINGISFTNPGFTIDSYNSCNGAYGGANVDDDAVIGVMSGTMTFKNPIKGTAVVGSTGTLDMSGSASLGPSGGPTATTVAQANTLGYITTVSVSFPSVTVPFDTNAVSNLGTLTGPTTINGGDYVVNKISLSGGSITFNGNVRLYVKGDFTTSGSGAINIPSGSSGEMYMNGKVASTGDGVINSSQDPSKFALYGLPTSTAQWNWTGSAAFYGMMYAPQTDIKFTGPGGMYGSMVGLTLSTTGGGSFHFDECLSGGGKPYNVASWQEYRYVSGSWVP